MINTDGSSFVLNKSFVIEEIPYIGGDNSYDYGVDFSASLSSSIYGNSDTVQPASYTVYYIMRVK